MYAASFPSALMPVSSSEEIVGYADNYSLVLLQRVDKQKCNFLSEFLYTFDYRREVSSYSAGNAGGSSQRKSAPLCLHAGTVKAYEEGSKFQRSPIAAVLLGVSAHAHTITAQSNACLLRRPSRSMGHTSR